MVDVEMVLPVVAGCSGLFAGAAVLYSKIRPIFPVKVNCWFCNGDTKVQHRQRDGWVCPACEQYNGFTQDGDYNRDIPAQYLDTLNAPVGCQKPKPDTQTSLALGNGFCQTCNLNQTLKVRALADYTPINPDNYDQEVDEYRKRLERTYSLCRQCEATLHQTLGKQESWLKPKLISWRLMQSSRNKQQIYEEARNSALNSARTPLHLRVLHLLGVVLSVALFLCSLHHLQHHSGTRLVSLDFGLGAEVYLSSMYKFSSALVISGLSLVLLVIFSSGKELLLVSDAIASFVWVGLLALASSKQLIVAKDYNSLQVMLSFAALLLTLWTSVVPRSSSVAPTRPRPPLNKSRMSSASSAGLEDSQCTLNASLSDDIPNTPPSSPRLNDVTSTPYHANLSSIGHPLQTGVAPSPLPTRDSFQNGMAPSPVPRSVAPSPFPHMSPFSQPTAPPSLDDTMGSLKIGSPMKKVKTSGSTPFSPRALFSEKPGYNPKLNDSFCSQKVPGSPTRISTKNITQSSWVAGGYWGHPVSPSRDHNNPGFGVIKNVSNMFPLSRSSSQSSGFISQNSGFAPYNQAGSLPNSQPGSICGDDRASVLSEPIYKSWAYPGSLYGSDSLSQYSYSRPPGLGRSDAQSLYSCASALSSHSQLRGQSSPTSSTSFLFHDALGNQSEDSSKSSSKGTTRVRKADTTFSDLKGQEELKQPLLNYRNPWVTFFLGMSFAANGFLIALLILRGDYY